MVSTNGDLNGTETVEVRLFLEFVLAALAAFRLTVLVQCDGITERWRERFYDHFPPDQERAEQHGVWNEQTRKVDLKQRSTPRNVSFWGQLVVCPWCAGWWISVGLWAVLWASGPLALPWLWPWALSAVVGLLRR